MIQPVQKSCLVNIHPLKELENQIVVLTSVRRIRYGMLWDKTNWFVMGDTVSKIVYLTQLIKHKGVVVLNRWSAEWLGGKYL